MNTHREQMEHTEQHEAAKDAFDKSYPKNSVLNWLEDFARGEPTEMPLPPLPPLPKSN